MGVKDLWSILSPVCEKKSLWELQNKVIAIDLSAWICDSQCLAKTPQVNMYLRNLFFRTSYLLLLGAKPVFVLEGKAPDLKAKTIQNRLKKISNNENPDTANKAVRRTRLTSLQKQCTELLSCLGVMYVEAPGEAEAFCAYLNKEGLVDGVISQDSDAFLYGAREVYRNFQMAPKYTFDCYTMDEIERKLSLSRTKLIGYSLLSGSDYNSGVHKVGKETALKFLTTVPDEDLFQRFLLWKDEASFIFSEHRKRMTPKEIEIEEAIRERALEDANFPNLDVISEFTLDPGHLSLDYKWNKPHLAKFIIFADKKLTWDEEYSMKKMVPLMARWHLENNGENNEIKIISIDSAHGKSTHFKVTWNLLDIVTVERKDLVENIYPDLVAEYEAQRNLKTNRTSKKRGRKKKDEETAETSKEPPQKTLINYLLKDHKYLQEPVTSEDNNYLNLSDIIEDIITRPNSNPAVKQLPKLV